MGLEHGESKYDELEARIATFPTISLPTITLEGDANGAPHGDPSAYARKYTGTYEHRNIVGGIGHNLPQEAPEAFAQGSLRTLALWIAGPSQKLRHSPLVDLARPGGTETLFGPRTPQNLSAPLPTKGRCPIWAAPLPGLTPIP